MGNIKNYNFNNIDLKLSNDDYWDFYLANDDANNGYCTPVTSGDCFVVWYDFNDSTIYPNSAITSPDIYSLVSWDKAVNTGYTFNTIGLTGIDNGLIIFDKNPLDLTNDALLLALTGTTLDIPSGDTRLHMTRVTGTTGEYIYPYSIIPEPTKPMIGNFLSLAGGFYQGYYKIDGSNYSVLPTRVNQSWSAEFWLTTKQYTFAPTGTTLNDKYPENAGMFFYMGTRAENKFWNKWEGSDTGCTSACTTAATCTDVISEWCTVPKESEITIVGDYGMGVSLDPPRTNIDLVTNGFLIYGRAYDGRPDVLSGSTIYNPKVSTLNSYYCGRCGVTHHDGLGTQTACSYDGKGIAVAHIRKTLTNTQNPFLLYGRASGIVRSGDTRGCCGGPNDGLGSKTVNNFNGVESDETSIDYNIDIIDNALGFRITPDGRIGYKLLTVTGTCISNGLEKTYISGTTIKEEYSIENNLFDPDFWQYVVVKFETDYLDDCELKIKNPRIGKLKFYIDGYLKWVVNDFPEFIGKRLDEYKSKQVGVPFNISLGGGSQGLIDSQTFGGLDLSDRGLPIEKNFAGTFLGGISQFKFNICKLSLCQIQNNYSEQSGRYI